MQLELLKNSDLLGRCCCVMLEHWHTMLFAKMQHRGVDTGTATQEEFRNIAQACKG